MNQSAKLSTHLQNIPPQILLKADELYARSLRSFERFPNIKEEFDRLELKFPKRAEIYKKAAFYCVVICVLQDWTSAQTLDRVVMGCLLQDIGLGENLDCASLIPEAMSESQKKSYGQHFKMGVFILDQLGFNNEAVKQIVYQHHEYFDGSGKPNALAGHKIFASARLVNFMTDIAEIVCAQQCTILEALKILLGEKKGATKYDPELVRLMLTMIIKKGKK